MFKADTRKKKGLKSGVGQLISIAAAKWQIKERAVTDQQICGVLCSTDTHTSLHKRKTHTSMEATEQISHEHLHTALTNDHKYSAAALSCF